MEKAEIMTVLMKNLKQAVPDLTVDTLQPTQSMKEVGANSLDIVDVVSTTMRQLKVKIPREQLSTIKTVGALVDALHAAQPKA
jgi:acyl carrier protein